MSILDGSLNREDCELYIIVNGSVGAEREQYSSPWTASVNSSLVVDAKTDEVISTDAVIQWEVSDKSIDDRSYMKTFEPEKIYHIKAQKDLNKLTGSKDLFYFVEMISDNSSHPILNDVLQESQEDIIYNDEFFGNSTLNKKCSQFDIDINWKGSEATLFIDVDQNDTNSWQKQFAIARDFIQQQDYWDDILRTASAEKLYELDNEWDDADDIYGATGSNIKISQEDFAKRLSMAEIILNEDGDSFIIYYYDDDVFFGHVVEINGSLSQGIEHIHISG